MAFGIMVQTSIGLTDLADFQTVRSIYSSNRTNRSGSVTVSSAARSDAVALIVPKDGKLPPSATVDTSTGLVSWFLPFFGDASDYSTNFTLHVLVSR